MEKAVSTRQLAVLSFMTAVAVKMFMLPSLLVSEAGRNGWIVMLVYLLVDLAVLGLIVFSLVKSRLGFYELLESVLGKIGARILISVSVLFLLFKMTLMLGEVKVFFSESLFEQFNWAVYAVPLIGLLAYAGSRSSRFIARTAEILLPFIGLSMVLLFIMSAKTDFSNLFPILREPKGDWFKYSLWLGDYSVLTIFIGKTDVKKRAPLKILLTAVAASLAVTFFSIVLSAEFGNIPHLIEYGHNLGGLAKHTGAQNFGRLDLLVFAVWISAVFIKLMVYFYAAVRHTLFVTKIGHPAFPYITAGVYALAVYLLCVFAFPTQASLYGAATWPALQIVAIAEQFAIPATVFAGTIVDVVRARRVSRV